MVNAMLVRDDRVVNLGVRVPKTVTDRHCVWCCAAHRVVVACRHHDDVSDNDSLRQCNGLTCTARVKAYLIRLAGRARPCH